MNLEDSFNKNLYRNDIYQLRNEKRHYKNIFNC